MFRTAFVTSLLLAAACTAPVDGDQDPGDDVGTGSGTSTGAGSGDETTSSGDGGGSGSASGAAGSLAAQTWKVLDHDYQVQQTGYWCGPTATHIALSTRIAAPSQGALANELPTTTNGTDWIGQVTRTLNNHLGTRYVTVEMPNDPPTPGQRDQLWRDISLSIEAGHGLVANIVAPPSNHPPGYPNSTIYHYFTVVGYNPATREAYIADSANFQGNQHYWLTLDKLASLIPPKGYSTYRCGANRAVGEIGTRFGSLGGCGGFLGSVLTDETPTPDGAGRYNVFEGGSIYWSPSTGAFEVHGAIRDKYAEVGWEAGLLGYPLSNETKTPDGVGRFSVFEHGSIYWSPATGAHEVHGRIRDAWKDEGWEGGHLGYPTSDEYVVPEGRRSDFQHGSITWVAATNSTKVN